MSLCGPTPSAFVRPRVPCVPCVSRLPRVSFYRLPRCLVTGTGNTSPPSPRTSEKYHPRSGRPALENPTSSPPSPSGGGRGRVPIRGRSRRGPPRHRRPTARRPRRDAPPSGGGAAVTPELTLVRVDKEALNEYATARTAAGASVDGHLKANLSQLRTSRSTCASCSPSRTHRLR